MKRLVSLGLVALVSACSAEPSSAPSPTTASSPETALAADAPARAATPGTRGGPTRVLLVIADDLGIDALGKYADISGAKASDRPFPSTPTIDGICSGGVRFTTAWATPTCTPTRGSILTGRYGFRTGLDGVGRGKQIKATEQTLPQLLGKRGDIATANIGKWHLGHTDELGGLQAPNQMGWDHYAGAIDNLKGGYFDYPKVVDGKEIQVSNYATTETVDDALAWASSRGGDESWFMWLAFNAPHVPFHLPPEGLHKHPGASEAGDQYDAAVEAMDSELGRLLAALPSDVTVIFIGDNGSPARAVRRPLNRKQAKGTLYEGGVHVPMCVAGPAIREPGRDVDQLVSVVDVFATVLGLFDTPAGAAGEDSTSLQPYFDGPSAPAQRQFVYSQQNRQHERNAKHAGGRIVRSERYKLMELEDGSRALFDLEEDPRETRNLLDDGSSTGAVASELAGLEAELARLR